MPGKVLRHESTLHMQFGHGVGRVSWGYQDETGDVMVALQADAGQAVPVGSETDGDMVADVVIFFGSTDALRAVHTVITAAVAAADAKAKPDV